MAKQGKTIELVWTETSKNEWEAPVEDLGGARIRLLAGGYYTYRDVKYLGREESLEAAKLRAQDQVYQEGHLLHIGPGGVPAFLMITQKERKAETTDYLRRNPAPSSNSAFIQQRNPDEEEYMSKYEAIDDLNELLKIHNDLVEVAKEKGLDQFRTMTKFPAKDYAIRFIERVESSIRAKDSGDKSAKGQKGPAVKPAPAAPKGRKAAPEGVETAPEATEGEGEPENTATAKPRAGKQGPKVAAKAAPAPKGRKAAPPAPPKVAKGKAAAPATGKAPAAPKVAKEARTGKGGEFLDAIEARDGTNKAKLAALLMDRLGKDVKLTEVTKAVYGTTSNPAIAAVINGIAGTLKKKNVPYEIRRKDDALGLYPLRK